MTTKLGVEISEQANSKLEMIKMEMIKTKVIKGKDKRDVAKVLLENAIDSYKIDFDNFK